MTKPDILLQLAPERDLIAGLIKGMALIGAFNACNPRLTISEAAARARMSRAAARRYLLTLKHLGLATQEGRWFRLTPKGLVFASCVGDVPGCDAEEHDGHPASDSVRSAGMAAAGGRS